jgi:hypothetical protein
MTKSEINTATGMNMSPPVEFEGEINRVVTMEQITPALAEKYLDTMPHNRRTRQGVINNLVRAIKTDSWFPTIEPIHFDSQGRLRNGQHRMWAILESGRTLEFLIVRGATEEEIDAIDTGTKRSPGDVITLRHGTPDGDVAATVLKLLWMMEEGYLPGGGGLTGRSAHAPTNHQMAQYFLQHPKLLTSIQYVNQTPAIRTMGPKGTMTFCHYLITHAGGAQADEFWNCLAMAIYGHNNDPILRLRERLTKSKNAGTQNKRDKLTVTEMSALIIKGWNFWISNTPVQVLRWTRFGDKPEAFPVPRMVSDET